MKETGHRKSLPYTPLTGAVVFLLVAWSIPGSAASASLSPKISYTQTGAEPSERARTSQPDDYGRMSGENLLPVNRKRETYSPARKHTEDHRQTGSNCEDVNTANARTLQRVRGIGRAKAQAIIEYRNQFGPFTSLDELTRVKGIGPATVENFRRADFCVRESGEPAEDSAQAPPDTSATYDGDCDDINTASASALQRVSRIGRVKAQAIVEYREEFGPFRSLDELTRVKGIGQATLGNFREAGFCVLESSSTSDHSGTRKQSPSEKSAATNCRNVNTANAATLQQVSRIGPVRAQAIIDYREQFGPFQSLDELTRVKGIGPATLENFHKAGFCVQESSNYGDSQGNLSEASLDDSTATDHVCEDINTASVAALQRVRGIGPVRSLAIINHRNQSGPFKSMDGLLDVRGMDPDIFDNFAESGFCVGSLHTSAMNPSSPAYLLSIRDLYGGWMDVDEDCQNTRHEILIATSRPKAKLDKTECMVIAGEWEDAYTGTIITNPEDLDIDHFIPLAEVHRSGGAAWSDSLRYAFGNDLSENGMLIPVSASENRSKGDRDPAGWLPKNESYHCQYVERWVALKEAWRLTMDYHERQKVEVLLTQCASDTELL